MIKNLPANAGDRVWPLIREDSTCLRSTKSGCHTYWACALEPLFCKKRSPNTSTREHRPLTLIRQSPCSNKELAQPKLVFFRKKVCLISTRWVWEFLEVILTHSWSGKFDVELTSFSSLLVSAPGHWNERNVEYQEYKLGEKQQEKSNAFPIKGLLDFKVGNITELLMEKSHDWLLSSPQA